MDLRKRSILSIWTFGFFLNDEDLNFKLKEKIDILRQFESRQV